MGRKSCILRTSLAIFLVGAWNLVAQAIYVNPTPNAAGLNNAGPLLSPEPPPPPFLDSLLEAGGMTQTTTVLDPATGAPSTYTCSGTLIQSNIRPRRDWVLTAGHCTTDLDAAASVLPNTNGQFYQMDAAGPLAATFASDRIRRHRSYNDANLNNDVGLMRLDAGPLGNDYVGPLGKTLLRNPIAGTEEFISVGSGAISNLGILPLTRNNDIGGQTTERYSRFTAAGLVGGAAAQFRRSTQFQRGGTGTQADPFRQICGGDSGGPSLFGAAMMNQVVVGGQIGGVHSYGLTNTNANNACYGTVGTMGDANITLPFLHNWVDSYTRKAIFWDKLRINGLLVDSFESGGGGYDFGENGFAAGWGLVNVPHPTLGNIVSDPNAWRYINAIGNDNLGMSELYLDGDSSQGEIFLGGGASVIRKTFAVMVPADPNLFGVCGAGLNCGAINVDAHRLWNSLGLAEDVGVGLVGGAISWAGLVTSDLAGGIDQWTDPVPRVVGQVVPAGNQNVNVYLVNLPEPSTPFAIAVAFLAGTRLRRRLRIASDRFLNFPGGLGGSSDLAALR